MDQSSPVSELQGKCDVQNSAPRSGDIVRVDNWITGTIQGKYLSSKQTFLHVRMKCDSRSRVYDGAALSPGLLSGRVRAYGGAHLNALQQGASPLVIFTQSLDTGDVPADWRAANISPIFKKGDKTSPVNYRPVVRLFADDCLLYRVIEKPSDALDLQKDLDALTRWQDTWQMSFNPSKCHTLHITQHLYAHTWSTVRLYGIPTPSVVPRRWSESNEGRREWLTINEWNKLPGQLVKAQTVEAFKAGLLAAQP
ncbi:hypothetical protein Bbelb_371060 [Branchiostoma belcheri]|nr:hypothetical protein Bbelb_371060 [Branchiostoma belcheri]